VNDAAAARSFAEGEKDGGEILFEEPPGAYRWRRGRVYMGLWMVMGLSVGFAPFYFLLPPPGQSGFLTTVVPLEALLLVGALIGIKIEKPKYAGVTPFRIYRGGVSSGFGATPYRRLADVYSIDSTVSNRHRVPFTIVTFVDGTEMTLSKGGLRDPIVMMYKEYERAVEILRAWAGRVAVPRLPWDPAARGFIEGALVIRGPTMLKAERVARQHKVEIISKRFLAEHWREIAEGPGTGIRWFRQAAAEEFGPPDA
jgi:hypothetical protein